MILSKQLADEIFYSIFLMEKFELRTGTPLHIHYDETIGKIIVRTHTDTFRLLHEMAHIVETPIANLAKPDFGLSWNNLVGSSLEGVPRKTEVSFKRELRVFGIQLALNEYVEAKFKNPCTMRDSKFQDNVIYNLTGVGHIDSSHSRYSSYMSESLRERYPIHQHNANVVSTYNNELAGYIKYKLAEYKYQYSYTKLPQILKRKFDYIKENV